MEKFYVTWEEVEELVNLLAKQIAQSGYQIEYIFGLQRGGLIPAVILSHKLGIPMTQDPTRQNILIVDDICDSGETFISMYDEHQKGYEKFNRFFICQDPTMGSEMSGLSAECKADLILANEGRLRKTNDLYRTFNEKKSCLVNVMTQDLIINNQTKKLSWCFFILTKRYSLKF